MSKTYLESMGLHNIDSIDITNSNLGQGINDRFENIGYNFNKILKSEYLRGHSGSNMSTAICEISNSTEEVEDVFYYSKNQSGQVQLTNVSGASIKHMIGSKLINHYDVNNSWVDKIFQKPSTIYFITENDSEGNKYIKTSLPYYIIDPDFASQYQNLYNTNDVTTASNFIDRSCVIYFDTQNEDGCLEVKIYNNIPTIYYDTIVKDFCWRINGERTGISAKGIPGQKGLKGSSFLLGQFKYSETNNPVDGYNELSSIYMVNNSGDGKWYDVNNEEQVSELLGITNLDHGSPIIAIGLTTDTTQSNTPTTKLVLGVLHISTGANGKSQYNIAYDSKNMNIGSIISRADYFESLSDSDSLFLNSRNNDDIQQVTIDDKNYNLGHFIKPSFDDTKGQHVLSMGVNIYDYSNSANTKIPTSIMGAKDDKGNKVSNVYIGDAPSNIISTLNVNYNELNCKDVISWGRLTVKKGLTADGCDVEITARKTTEGNTIGGNLKTAGNITTGGRLDVSGNARVNEILTVGSSGSFGGNLFVRNIIGHTTDKTPLNIRDGIYIRNSKVSLETMPVQMWQPDNGKYNVRFNDSYVFLQNSYLHVTGNSGNGNIGIHSTSHIKTNGQLIADDGINVGVKTNGRKIILSGPVQIGNPASYASDPDHLVYGNLVTRSNLTVQGTVNFNNTLTVTRGLIAKDTLTVTGDTTVNKLTVNGNTTANGTLSVTGDTTVNKLTINGPLTVNDPTQIIDNTTLGSTSSHKHVIHGEISIIDWVASDAMIKEIFN